jgi:hypothetical protein
MLVGYVEGAYCEFGELEEMRESKRAPMSRIYRRTGLNLVTFIDRDELTDSAR